MSSSTGTDRGRRGPTLYVANFDFDDRLAKPAMRTLPKPLRAINARLAPLLEPLCGPGDAVALPGNPVSDDAERGSRGSSRGAWSGTVLTLAPPASVCGTDALARTMPDPAAVRAVNSRRWQFETERALGVLPAGSALCEDRTTLIFDAACRRPPRRLGD